MTEDQYERARTELDALVDEVGENEAHPKASLMELLGEIIEEHEDSECEEPCSVTWAETLREPLNTFAMMGGAALLIWLGRL